MQWCGSRIAIKILIENPAQRAALVIENPPERTIFVIEKTTHHMWYVGSKVPVTVRVLTWLFL